MNKKYLRVKITHGNGHSYEVNVRELIDAMIYDKSTYPIPYVMRFKPTDRKYEIVDYVNKLSVDIYSISGREWFTDSYTNADARGR